MSIKSLLVGLLLCSVLSQCRDTEITSPWELLDTLSSVSKAKDAGGVMNLVDVHYKDGLGGPARLENDLRQLFAVYGGLRIKMKDDGSFSDQEIRGRVVIEGKRLRFEGPIHLKISQWPSGVLILSGLLTDLRGILSALRERRIALESRSCDRLTQVVSPIYGGTVDGRKKLIKKLETEYKTVGARAMLLDEVNILVDHTEAQVVQSFLLITRIDELKEENRGREKLILRKEGSSWRFAGGLG